MPSQFHGPEVAAVLTGAVRRLPDRDHRTGRVQQHLLRHAAQEQPAYPAKPAAAEDDHRPFCIRPVEDLVRVVADSRWVSIPVAPALFRPFRRAPDDLLPDSLITGGARVSSSAAAMIRPKRPGTMAAEQTHGRRRAEIKCSDLGHAVKLLARPAMHEDVNDIEVEPSFAESSAARSSARLACRRPVDGHENAIACHVLDSLCLPLRHDRAWAGWPRAGNDRVNGPLACRQCSAGPFS